MVLPNQVLSLLPVSVRTPAPSLLKRPELPLKMPAKSDDELFPPADRTPPEMEMLEPAAPASDPMFWFWLFMSNRAEPFMLTAAPSAIWSKLSSRTTRSEERRVGQECR